MTINFKNCTIELIKSEAKAAGKFNSAMYNDLKVARTDYPTFVVVTKAAPKKKDCLKGPTYEYMETYIQKHENADQIMDEFKEAATYGEIRKWFLAWYPELTETRKRVDAILNKNSIAWLEGEEYENTLKVNHEDRTIVKAVYIAIGINLDGRKDVLGIGLARLKALSLFSRQSTAF